MADLLHQHVDGQLGPVIALEGSLADIPEIIAEPGNAQKPALARQLALRFLDRETQVTHGVGQCGRIEVTDPVVVGKSGLGAEAQTAADGRAVAHAGHRAASAEMAGNHPERGPSS